MASVYVLLKGAAKSGRLTFHGVAETEASADAWSAGGSGNWYYEHELESGDDVTAKPIASPSPSA